MKLMRKEKIKLNKGRKNKIIKQMLKHNRKNRRPMEKQKQKILKKIIKRKKLKRLSRSQKIPFLKVLNCIPNQVTSNSSMVRKSCM